MPLDITRRYESLNLWRIFFEKGGRSVQCGIFSWDELGSDILSVGRTGE
uniref:Uncharacterized protein n=1 Tax=Meloidogyne enterolobii TaxID=390850 RepID=A0A6V7XBP3_MELEN|nr:unnamed protein product [Meloidogyne enterolobii]